jgi:hypothetical protein
MENDIKELMKYLTTVQEFDKDAAQDPTTLHAYLIELSNMLARANYMMALYGKKFREEKTRAYHKLKASSESQQKYYAPSLAKDYIDSQCSDTGYAYDLDERVSRLISHTSDSIRTIVYSLRSERQLSGYQT